MPEFRLLICTTHEFLSLRFGTSFSTFLIFILSTKNGSSLRFLCSSLGHSLSASKICSFFSFLISLSFFSGERASTFSDANPFLGGFFDYCLSVKVICTQLLETSALFMRILLVFHMLIISLGKTFNCLMSLSS